MTENPRVSRRVSIEIMPRVAHLFDMLRRVRADERFVSASSGSRHSQIRMRLRAE